MPRPFAVELLRLVQGAVVAQLADKKEHHVLAGDPRVLRHAVEDDLDGLGHAQPQLAGGPGGGQIGGADAGGERVDAAVGATVGVGAQHQVAGHDVALVRQQGVLDASLTRLEVVLDIVLAREIPARLGHGGGGDVLGRHEVAHDDEDLVRVGELRDAVGVEDADRQRGRDIIAHDDVGLADDHVAGGDAGLAGSPREDVFTASHAHDGVPRLPHAGASLG